MPSRLVIRAFAVTGVALSVVAIAAARALVPPTTAPPVWADPIGPAAAAVVPPVAPVEPGTLSDSVTVRTTVDRETVLRSDGLAQVEVVIASTTPAADRRVPTDMVVVLDTSGSMSGTKILDAKAATQALIDQLGPEDRLSLVSFSDRGRVTWPLQSRDRSAHWRRAVEGLAASGGTHMQNGLDVGHAQLATASGRAQRVVLISDGHPNTPDGLTERAAGFAAGETPLSAVGIGADYDEALMAGLADSGTGNFHWVTRGHDLASVFAEELGAASRTVATGVKLRVALPEGVQLVDAAGLPVEHVGSEAVVRLGGLQAEQERRLWLTMRVDPHLDASAVSLGDVTVSWSELDGQPGVVAAVGTSVGFTDDRAAFVAGLDADAWSRSVVEEQYTRLQTALSAAVQSGDKETAQAAIADYKSNVGSLNAVVGSAAVVDNLAEVDALEADLEAQFVGEDQAYRQNMWSKKTRSSSWSARRR